MQCLLADAFPSPRHAKMCRVIRKYKPANLILYSSQLVYLNFIPEILDTPSTLKYRSYGRRLIGRQCTWCHSHLGSPSLTSYEDRAQTTYALSHADSRARAEESHLPTYLPTPPPHPSNVRLMTLPCALSAPHEKAVSIKPPSFSGNTCTLSLTPTAQGSQ